MKKKLINIILMFTVVSSSFSSLSVLAVESLSANMAVVSQYFFRGTAQTTTASASTGANYEVGNFSVGTWAADVKDGIEIDLYGSYGFETNNGLGLSVGFTSYQYTGDFDSAYNEINLGLSYSFLSLAYNIGKHDKDVTLEIDDADYDFISVTAEYKGFYATYGSWGKDFDGDYIELGYGADISGFDLGIALIINSKELDVETNKGDETLVFSLSKSF